MRPSPALEMILSNDIAEMGRVDAMVNEFGRRHDLPKALLHDVHLCLDEILSNIIRHGFDDDGKHEIALRMSVAENRVVIEVTDDARPFDPVQFPSAVRSRLDARKPGGLGIAHV